MALPTKHAEKTSIKLTNAIPQNTRLARTGLKSPISFGDESEFDDGVDVGDSVKSPQSTSERHIIRTADGQLRLRINTNIRIKCH